MPGTPCRDEFSPDQMGCLAPMVSPRCQAPHSLTSSSRSTPGARHLVFSGRARYWQTCTPVLAVAEDTSSQFGLRRRPGRSSCRRRARSARSSGSSRRRGRARAACATRLALPITLTSPPGRSRSARTASTRSAPGCSVALAPGDIVLGERVGHDVLASRSSNRRTGRRPARPGAGHHLPGAATVEQRVGALITSPMRRTHDLGVEERHRPAAVGEAAVGVLVGARRAPARRRRG